MFFDDNLWKLFIKLGKNSRNYNFHEIFTWCRFLYMVAIFDSRWYLCFAQFLFDQLTNELYILYGWCFIIFVLLGIEHSTWFWSRTVGPDHFAISLVEQFCQSTQRSRRVTLGKLEKTTRQSWGEPEKLVFILKAPEKEPRFC